MFEDDYNNLKSELEELESEFNNPGVTSDPDKMRDLGKKYERIKDIISNIDSWEELNREINDNRVLLSKEEDLEMKQLIEEEISKSEANLGRLENEIKKTLTPPDPNDSRNAILEIRAGAGGDEAALFAAEIFRMYLLYSQKVGWKIEPINQHKNDLGGIKEVIVLISGNNVYGDLKNESGVHRVQRIPQTEKSGRVHTSTVTVAILPEATQAEIEIKEKDLRIDVFRSSGPGGQSVNMTDSAVRITHLPTGIVVSCQDQKSQHKNKEKAMGVLSARLLALEEEKRKKDISNMRSSQVGTGDRSEKIRTYNFPQNRVTDHRLKKNWHNLEEIMEGEIGEILRETKEIE